MDVPPALPRARGLPEAGPDRRKPDWLKIRLNGSDKLVDTRRLMRSQRLHTVCEEARCPNLWECWAAGTATFMILGATCTRACSFCAVHSGRPTELDLAEPGRVAAAVVAMALDYVVVTSVARDDLTDGGAALFADTIEAIRAARPGVKVEVLVPDLGADRASLAAVLAARPDVFNHNLETVRRLTPYVRSRARYETSLAVHRTARALAPGTPLKSGMMVGLGETREELREAMDDLRAAGVEILTIGQYLQPTRDHLQVIRYLPPEEFAELRVEALERGFRHCEASPLARSSYHAKEQERAARE